MKTEGQRRPLLTEAEILERARSLANESMWTVALQRRRLRSVEPEDEQFVMRRWVDWQFQQRYEWLYVCGFVRPTTGDTVWWLLSTVTAALFGQVLAAFAREVRAGPDRHILLVLDGAGWHTGDEVAIPEGIHLHFLPSYSPELQPAEHLWPLTTEPLANRRFDDLPTLETVQAERCRVLQQRPDLIRSHTLFHWWPTDV